MGQIIVDISTGKIIKGFISSLCIDRLIKDRGFEEVFMDWWKTEKKEEKCLRTK
jgi:hypothetical protein